MGNYTPHCRCGECDKLFFKVKSLRQHRDAKNHRTMLRLLSQSRYSRKLRPTEIKDAERQT